jgi:hypothetical protein
VTSTINSELPAAGIDTHAVPDLRALTPQVRAVVEHAYGLGTGEIFLITVPLAVVALIAVALMKEVPLGGKSGIRLNAEREERQLPAWDDEPVPEPGGEPVRRVSAPRSG